MKKLLILLSCFLLVGCGQKEVVEIEDLEVETKDLELELNDKVFNTEGIVDIKNGYLLDCQDYIDTEIVGEQEVKLSFLADTGDEKEVVYNVKVIDNEAPVITFKNKKLTTTEGVKIKLLKNVTASDNSKEEIKVSVEGEYDFNKVGTYTLYYVASDSSLNTTKEEFTLVVNKKVEEKPKVVEQPKKETTEPKKESSNSGSKQGQGTSSSLNGTKTSKGYTITVKNGITYIDGIMIANKTYAVPKSLAPGGLTGATKSAADAMIAAAKKDGVNLYVASGYRSYATQDSLWTKRMKKNGKAFADSGTARAGHSEHQTGLAFDMCGSGNGCISSEYHNSKGAKWMAENAYKYGLILRYPKGKENETGYKYESWHFRYVGVELATKLYNGGNWITLESYYGITSKYDY